MNEISKEEKVAQAYQLLKEAIPNAIDEAEKVETEKTDIEQEKFTWLIVLIGGLIAFVFDYLCNSISWLNQYSIISFVFTLITSLLVGFKFFDYATPQINFFSNWKGNQYEVIAKAMVISTILLVLGIVVYSAANTNVSGASPKDPIRETNNYYIHSDSTTTNRNQREPESEQ